MRDRKLGIVGAMILIIVSLIAFIRSGSRISNPLVTRVDETATLDVLTLSYQGETITLQRQKQPTIFERRSYMTASFYAAMLKVRDGCLAGVTVVDGSENTVHILWPANVDPVIDTVTGKIALSNDSGVIIARLDEPISGGGGQVPNRLRNDVSIPECFRRSDKLWIMNPM